MQGIAPIKESRQGCFSMTSYQKEVDFLISSLKIYFNNRPEDIALVKQLLTKGINWHNLIQFASFHKVIPLLLHTIEESTLQVPPSIFSYLKRRTCEIERSNLSILEEFFRLLKMFTENDIKVMLYKGFSIASFYGEMKLRQSDDLDILVRRKDFYKVHDLMLANGYCANWPMDIKQLKSFLKFEHSYHFHNDVGLEVDIQWRFASRNERLLLPIGKVWERCVNQYFLGNQIPTLSKIDLLTSMCLHHGIVNCWSQLRWIVDIAKVLTEAPESDWEDIILETTRLDLKRTLLVGSFLARKLFHITLPRKLNALIESDSSVNALQEEIFVNLFKHRVIDNSFLRFKIKFGLRAQWKSKCKLVIEALKPTYKDRLLIDLPDYLNFLYYFIRTWRVAILTLRHTLK
jgi:hypothetical protein